MIQLSLPWLDYGHKPMRRRRFAVFVSVLLALSFIYARSGLRGVPHRIGVSTTALDGVFGRGPKSTADIAADGANTYDRSLPKPALPEYCNAFPDDRIAIAVKTSATEALEKLPMLLVTSLQCIHDPIFLSDLDQTMGPYRIHDVLADFPAYLMEENPHFDLYRQQQKLAADGREHDIPALVSKAKNQRAVLDLDKYKFLHMLERAWSLQPDRDWYVFIEADTYLSYTNLHRWLSNNDPAQEAYFGGLNRFAVGGEEEAIVYVADSGAGIVLSGAAMREFCVQKEGVATRFAPRISVAPHGNVLLATALSEELDLQVTNALPSFNPHPPDLIAYGESNWCELAVTMHGVDSRAVDAMHVAEHDRQFEELLFRDVFAAHYQQGLPQSTRNNWNAADFVNYTLIVPPKNIKPPKKWGYTFYLWDPHEKVEACELACVQHLKCFQWTFVDTVTTNIREGEQTHKSVCHISSAFRLGEAKPAIHERNKTTAIKTSWTSGWITKRTDQFRSKFEDCTIKPADVKPDPEPFYDMLSDMSSEEEDEEEDKIVGTPGSAAVQVDGKHEVPINDPAA